MAYQEARELLACVMDAKISDAKLRDQALRAARSVCLNIAEGAGRTSWPEKARVYSIARGECCEVVAALEIALVSTGCVGEAARGGARHAETVYALLSGLIRRAG